MVGTEHLEDDKYLAAELVVKALADLDEERGSTQRTIEEYIASEYRIPPRTSIKDLVTPSLKHGIEFGVVVQNAPGRYQLTNLMDNIVDLACRPRRRCNRSSKNFRRIDYKSADVCYEDKDHTGESPCACQGNRPQRSRR